MHARVGGLNLLACCVSLDVDSKCHFLRMAVKVVLWQTHSSWHHTTAAVPLASKLGASRHCLGGQTPITGGWGVTSVLYRSPGRCQSSWLQRAAADAGRAWYQSAWDKSRGGGADRWGLPPADDWHHTFTTQQLYVGPYEVFWNRENHNHEL